MLRIRTLGAVAVLVVATAAPAFAKAPIHHRQSHQWDQRFITGKASTGMRAGTSRTSVLAASTIQGWAAKTPGFTQESKQTSKPMFRAL